MITEFNCTKHGPLSENFCPICMANPDEAVVKSKLDRIIELLTDIRYNMPEARDKK